MKKYTIHFNRARRNGEENLLVMEFEREHFTNREFKNYVLYHLFDLVDAYSGKNKWLSAYIYCGDKKILTVRCYSEREDGTTTTTVFIARPREVFHKIREFSI